MWRKCSTCKAEIDFGETYFLCSVSTCQRNRTGLFFCSIPCWDAHLPMMRHRDAWAVEERAPTREAWQKEQEEAAMHGNADEPEGDKPAPEKRRIVGSAAGPAEVSAARTAEPAIDLADDDLPREVLVVVSKLKAYIKARSGMNTSDAVTGVLSEHLRKLCIEAIRNAARDGRKTVLERDFASLV